MDKELVRRITMETAQWARSKGFYVDVEDMTQHVLLCVSRNRRAVVSNICTDYVRSAYGRSGPLAPASHKARVNEKKFYVQIDEEIHGIQTSYELDIEKMDFSQYQSLLGSRDRAILTLRFKWEMSESEIGDVFGVSMSRISQELTDIKAKLKRIIKDRAK